jgi:hypothetical protein
MNVDDSGTNINLNTTPTFGVTQKGENLSDIAVVILGDNYLIPADSQEQRYTIAINVPNYNIISLYSSDACSMQYKAWKQSVMISTYKNGISDGYRENKYCFAFISINIKSSYVYLRSSYMLRQIIVLIATQQRQAKTYNQCVRCIFIKTAQ